MRILISGLFIGLLFLACGEKEDTTGSIIPDDEFINSFPELSLPFYFADSNLVKKHHDSLRIDTSALFKILPDSVISKDFGKSGYRVYAIGKIKNPPVQYFLISVVAGNKRAAYLFNLDSDFKYKSAITLVSTGFRNSTYAYTRIDDRFLITTYRERKQPENFSFKRNVYVSDAATDELILILTEPGDDLGIINPIDSLPSTHALAGDYRKDEKNFITVRDSPKAGELLFFIHFEENKGECIGEIKGTAKITGENTAEYYQPGNPCRLSFLFTGKKLEIKELDGCGSFRDIYCFFNGSYPLIAKPEKSK